MDSWFWLSCTNDNEYPKFADGTKNRYELEIPYVLVLANRYNNAYACEEIYNLIKELYDSYNLEWDSQTIDFVLSYLNKGANLGRKSCLYKLYDFYLNGKYVCKDIEKANYYKKRIEELDGSACPNPRLDSLLGKAKGEEDCEEQFVGFSKVDSTNLTISYSSHIPFDKVDNILKTTFSDTIIRKPEDLSFNEEGLVVWQKISYLPNERFHHYEDVYSGRVFGPISLRTNDFPIGEKGRKDLIYHNCFASLFILAKTCTYMESNNAGHNELYYAFYYHDMIFVDGYVENGLETGKWKFYYVDKLIIEAEFENGQLNGLCNFYDLDGNLIRSTKFINNKNVDELPNIQPSGQWSKRNPRKWEWIELKRFKE